MESVDNSYGLTRDMALFSLKARLNRTGGYQPTAAARHIFPNDSMPTESRQSIRWINSIYPARNRL